MSEENKKTFQNILQMMQDKIEDAYRLIHFSKKSYGKLVEEQLQNLEDLFQVVLNEINILKQYKKILHYASIFEKQNIETRQKITARTSNPTKPF